MKLAARSSFEWNEWFDPGTWDQKGIKVLKNALNQPLPVTERQRHHMRRRMIVVMESVLLVVLVITALASREPLKIVSAVLSAITAIFMFLATFNFLRDAEVTPRERRMTLWGIVVATLLLYAVSVTEHGYIGEGAGYFACGSFVWWAVLLFLTRGVGKRRHPAP